MNYTLPVILVTGELLVSHNSNNNIDTNYMMKCFTDQISILDSPIKCFTHPRLPILTIQTI